jgi:DNA polymerase III delta subunit
VKVKPEILLNNNQEILYKKILITGSDEPFISYMKDFVINNFKKRNFFIDNSGNYNKGIGGNLFSDKKTLFLLDDYPFIKNVRGETDLEDEHFLISSINGKKINTVKSMFAKEKNSLVVECYTLQRKTKKGILENFIKENNMILSSDVFWYILESFENNYVFFLQQLQTLSLYKKNINSVAEIEKALLLENNLELSRLFFNIFNTNKHIINILNKNISSVSDFYTLLNSIKFYFEIIRCSSDKETALSKFPRYLFAEKDIFLKIYNLLNKDKTLGVFNHLSKAEVLVRKHPDLYAVISLRFFLNLKKIIIF